MYYNKHLLIFNNYFILLIKKKIQNINFIKFHEY